MMSNCDVTNSVHQIQMTTNATDCNPPMKIFCVRLCGDPYTSLKHLHTNLTTWYCWARQLMQDLKW